MPKNIKNAALTAFRLALRPFVRLMLRNGITWKQAAEQLKHSYVEIAELDYGLHGRKTNASRVAILTGLSRRDIKQVHDAELTDEGPALNRMNAATRVLGGWHTDVDFRTQTDAPAALDFDGSTNSFSELCHRYANDIPPTAMHKELIRVGALEERLDGTLLPLMRYYMPDSTDSDALLRAGDVMADIGNTVEFNLRTDQPSDTRSRFEGRASNAEIPAALAPKFRAYLELEGQGMLERADNWLAEHEERDRITRPRKKIRLGVGIYQIEDDGKR